MTYEYEYCVFRTRTRTRTTKLAAAVGAAVILRVVKYTVMLRSSAVPQSDDEHGRHHHLSISGSQASFMQVIHVRAMSMGSSAHIYHAAADRWMMRRPIRR